MWPHIEIRAAVSTESGVTLSVLNTGLGPAAIKFVEVQADSTRAEDWNGVLERMFGKVPESREIMSVRGRVLRSGDELPSRTAF